MNAPDTLSGLLDLPALLHTVPEGDGRRVVVGLSGGVDSAVSAWMLRQRGWDVVGLFMKNWEGDDNDEYCSTRQDWLDAASVADVIGVDIEAVNFAAEYREQVFATFLAEYQAGRTPNPDVLCNAEIKFKAFLEHAMGLGAQFIATGHYARVARDAHGRAMLLRGLDTNKDQSYFLHRLTQAQLARAVFPLGAVRKPQVRALAAQLSLPNAAKRDSTGICFIGERPFREFLQRYLPTRPGPIQTPEGKVLGEHVGLAFYTLGQRKGIGVGGTRAGSGEPWFVAAKDMANNRLVVVQGHDHPLLHSSTLVAAQASWIAGSSPDADPQPCGDDSGRYVALSAKTRYRQADAHCSFSNAGCAGQDGGHGLTLQRAASEGSLSQAFRLDFDEPQWAVTPGQSAVLYRGEICLGGGVIERVG